MIIFNFKAFDEHRTILKSKKKKKMPFINPLFNQNLIVMIKQHGINLIVGRVRLENSELDFGTSVEKIFFNFWSLEN